MRWWQKVTQQNLGLLGSGLALVVGLFSFGCSHGDGADNTVKNSSSPTNHDTVAVLDFSDKTTQLAHHAIIQVARTYRYMQLAVGYQVNARELLEINGSIDSETCARYVREFPSYTREVTTAKTELFRFDYVKCQWNLPYQNQQLSKQSNLLGSEDFAVHYDKDLPQSIHPELPTGSVTAVDISSPNLAVVLLAKTGELTNISRSVGLHATLVDATGGVANFLVDNTTTDSFAISGSKAHSGTITVTLSNFHIKVDMRNRVVKELVPGDIEIAVKVTQATSDAPSPKDLQITKYRLTADGTVASPKDVCETPAGHFKLVRENTGDVSFPTISVSSTGTEMTDAASGLAVPGRLCATPEEIPYMDEFESLYL